MSATPSEDVRNRDKTYRISASCVNCHWSGSQDFLKGVIAAQTSRECPRCGCVGTLVFGKSR